jgi:hypothetical protein
VYRTQPSHLAAVTDAIPPLEEGWRYEWPEESRDRPVLKGQRLATGYAGLYPQTEHRLDSLEYLQLAGTLARVGKDGTIETIPNPSRRASFPATTSATAQVAVDRPGHLVIRTESTTGGPLAITERFHDGWTATIDGARVPVLRWRGDFMACDVPTGAHVVEFRFRPRSFTHGVWASLVGAAALAAGLLVMARSRDDRRS